jgi:hypothetical protein
MSKTPYQIRKIIFSPAKLNENKNENNNLNNDKNSIKDNIFSSKEIPELMKGSKSNMNKLNIFHSPRNQIIKHFKESLSKLSGEEHNYIKNNNPNNNKMQKTKIINKIIISNKTDNISKNIDGSVWDSLAKKNIILLNKKNLEKNFNLENDKDINKTNSNKIEEKDTGNFLDQQKLLSQKLQKRLSLDNFLTDNKTSNLYVDPSKFTKNLEDVLKTDFYSLNNDRVELKAKNGIQAESNYDIDDQIEKENDNINKNLENNNFLSLNKVDSSKKYYTCKNDLDFKYKKTADNNLDTGKIILHNSKTLENKITKKISVLNSIDANFPTFTNNNINNKLNLPFNKTSKKSNNVNSNGNLIKNFNTNLFGKKIVYVSKIINISNIRSKKKLNTNKNLSTRNSKNLISEKILSIDNNNINPNTKLNNKKEENPNQAENPNFKELEKFIYSERNSIAKKKSMDKILSARKFLNVNISKVDFNIVNPKNTEENKLLNSDKNNQTNKKAHFNSFSIANLLSPHKHINLSQNFNSNFTERDLLKSNKNIVQITNKNNNKVINPQKSFTCISHDLTKNNKNNLSQNLEIGEYRRKKSIYELKTEKKKNCSKNFGNGLEKISLKSFESGSSKNNNQLNSCSRGNTFGANKFEDFGINKDLNREIFWQIKHQESIKNNDMFNFNSNKKVNNENGNGKSNEINEKIELKTINSENFQEKNSNKNDFNKKENGGHSNDLNYLNSENSKNNQSNFPLQSEIVFDKEKSNLINLNTYTLLKKQRNKNSLLNNDLVIMQENIQEELEIPEASINNALFAENNIFLGEIDYERKLTKESVLQSNIELNEEIEENYSENNLNSSMNYLNHKNLQFKKTEKMNFLNNEKNTVNKNFSNKSFGFGNTNEAVFLSNNEKESQKNQIKRSKTKDLLDTIIPSSIPKKKEKPNFNEIINNLRENSSKFLPLKIQKNEIIKGNSKKLFSNNLIKNEKFHNIYLQNNLSFAEIRNEELNKNNKINGIILNTINNYEFESNKTNKINKVDLNNFYENCENSVTAKNALKETFVDRNKIEAKDLSNSFIKTLKYENHNENLDFKESPIKLIELSNNENIINNITFPIQENSERKIKIANGDNADLTKFPLKNESFNNENLNEIKNVNKNKGFFTIDNNYDDSINNSNDYGFKKDDEEVNKKLTSNEKISNSNIKISKNTDQRAFRKINYNIDSSNNYRNKKNAINFIQDKKADLENFTNENKTNSNISHNPHNTLTTPNPDKNSNTISTLFNENEFNNTNKITIYYKNHLNFKERKNKNSLINFAEENKNKFTNITDISNKNNFTVSSIMMENTNINNNYNNKNEKRSINQSYKINRIFKNRHNLDEHILINESDNTHVKEFYRNANFYNLDFSMKKANEKNEAFTDQANRASLDDLYEEMIANENPVSFNSLTYNKNRKSNISGMKINFLN